MKRCSSLFHKIVKERSKKYVPALHEMRVKVKDALKCAESYTSDSSTSGAKESCVTDSNVAEVLLDMIIDRMK